MKFVRLPLAALALFSLTACSSEVLAPSSPAETNDVAPSISHPGGPVYNGQMFGSAGRESSDSTSTTITTTSSTSEPSLQP